MNVNYSTISAGMCAGTERFSGDAEMTRVNALTTYSGSVFQTEEAAAGKVRLPTVESLTDGMIRRLVTVLLLSLLLLGAVVFHSSSLSVHIGLRAADVTAIMSPAGMPVAYRICPAVRQ